MNKNKILIVSGKIKTGKTTRLMKWVSSQKNVDGILQPVVEEKRFLYHISSKTLIQLETNSTANVISIGKFNFSLLAFEKAKKIIEESLTKNLDYLVIDEIGPLELNGKGLEPIITKVISEKDLFSGKLILVVREEIFEKFLNHYKLYKDDIEIFEIKEI